MPTGSYTAIFFCNDSVGNINNTESVSFSVDVDLTVPSLTIVSPANISYPVSSIDFNVSADENLDVCLFSLDNFSSNTSMGVTGSTATFTNSSMPNGVYTVNFFCNDTSGNINNTEFVSFTISVTGTASEILEVRIGSITDSGRFLVRDNVTIFVKLKDNENDTVDLIAGSWVSQITYPLMNFTPMNLTNLATSSAGIWHNFTIDTRFELGSAVMPGTRFTVTIDNNDFATSNYFLVDNALRAIDIWLYTKGRYINGEII